jgi:hypothetical protein
VRSARLGSPDTRHQAPEEHQPIEIGFLPRVHDIEVKRRDRRTLQRGRDASNDNQIHLVAGQYLENGLEINRLQAAL